MADWPPPPTYAPPILVDEVTRSVQFNPIWLNWFLQLAQVLTAAGAGGGSGIQHNLTTGLQGGMTGEYYHLTANQHADVIGGASFKTIAVSGQSNVVAENYSDTLTLVAGTNISITTDAGTDSITINFTGSTLPADGDYGDIVVSGSGTIWTIKASAVEDKGYWSPLTNGDTANPELIFALGDTISVWTYT